METYEIFVSKDVKIFENEFLFENASHTLNAHVGQDADFLDDLEAIFLLIDDALASSP